MAVKIRLRRMGRKKLPIWAVVAADVRSPRDGRYIEDLGRYYPLEEPARVELKEDRVLYWLETGAQPTDTVRSLFSKQGLLLAHHLRLKGTSEEEIEQAVTAHRTEQEAKASQSTRLRRSDRRRQALEAEAKQAAKIEAEIAKKAAEEEAARQKAEAEARKKAAEEAQAQREAEAKAKAEAEAQAAEAQAEAAAEAETVAEAEAAATEAPAPAADAATEGAEAPAEQADDGETSKDANGA